MEEGRTRLVALLCTVALHVGVVAWLAASPERAARIVDAVSMDVVDLTPPEPEPEPEPEPPEEPDPPAEEEPEERQRPEKRRAAPPEEPEPPAEEEPPQDAPEEELDTPPQEPEVVSFDGFALSGTGTGFRMAPSRGGSALGVYAPGRRPEKRETRETTRRPTRPKRQAFSPVPTGQLSRSAEPMERGRPPYPESARRQYIEGAVRLMVEVRANGRVRNVRVLNDPGGGLADAALAYVRQLRFRPALDRQGRPVDSRVVWTVRYLLDD